MRERVLLVEDDDGIALSLVDRLEGEGYEVTRVADGDAVLELTEHRSFDIILLDLMLPGRNGIDICRDLRMRGDRTPILMLTARGETADKIVGLKLGADDYVTKPFDVHELFARVEALLRRAKRPVDAAVSRYTFGDVVVDLEAAQVTRSGSVLSMPALEYKLLCYFIEHRGEMLSRDRLLDEVWGYDRSSSSRTVDQHVASLRRKIEPAPGKPKYIVTTHGLGYRFVV